MKNNLFQDIKRDPWAYVWLAVCVLVVAGALYVLATSSVENWRHMYCTANEAQAIECHDKGWW